MKECMVLLLVCVRRRLLNSWEKTWFRGEFLDKQLQHWAQMEIYMTCTNFRDYVHSQSA